MKLKTPRENPYRHLNQIREEFKKDGFSEEWKVISPEKAVLGTHESFAKDLHIVKHQIFADKENKSQQKALYALASKHGTKGYLEAIYGEKADNTVDAFLRNVDASLNINNISI
jgi:hypothetical protein